jgi:hypothetical protein
VAKPEVNRRLGRAMLAWKNNIKIYLKGVGWECADWINLAQDMDKQGTFVNMVMSHRVSLHAGNIVTG